MACCCCRHFVAILLPFCCYNLILPHASVGGRTGGERAMGMEQIGGAPGVYDTPPLSGQTQAPTGMPKEMPK